MMEAFTRGKSMESQILDKVSEVKSGRMEQSMKASGKMTKPMAKGK